MQKFIKKLSLIITSIIIFSLCTACSQNTQTSEEAQSFKYTVFCNLNDADTGSQILTTEEAQALAREIIINKGTGYTENTAYGAYEEDGKVIGGNTLMYTFFFAEEDTVNEICAELKSELNISSVLIEKSPSDYHFSE